MGELIGQPAAKAGLDDAIAEKPIGIVLGFLRHEGIPRRVQTLIDQIPSADPAIAIADDNAGLARVMDSGLMALGWSTSEIRNGARELFRAGRDKIGADQMGEIISGTPGTGRLA